MIGPALARAKVVRVRIVGALKLLDGGDVDDKLIAVPLSAQGNTALTSLNDVSEFQGRYASVLAILKLWFLGYKASGVIEFGGWTGAHEANEILHSAEAAYRRGAEVGGATE